MTENDLKRIVAEVLAQYAEEGTADNGKAEKGSGASVNTATVTEGEIIADLTAESLQEQYFVPAAADEAGYREMKGFTPARLGVWRAGTRYNTWSMLRFRADHATAQDAVFTDVAEAVVEDNGFIAGQSQCSDRDEYITRPDLGRLLSEESTALYKKELAKGAKVLIMVGDGLSSAAIEANIADILPALKQGLGAKGLEVGPIPFIKYCRVGAMDDLGDLTDAEVICCLIGERPGLVTSESMSAYLAYKPTKGMPESRRTVVSNIHRGGTPAVEAGAHIADLIVKMLETKTSGVDLKL